jgi:UDP-N-acetylmuramate dehydrogenase
VLFTKDYNGIIIKPVIKGIEKSDEDDRHVIIRAGAGEEWDGFVHYCVMNNWAGIENLSWIPGTVGASPVQNIGAYGTEVMEKIDRVETLAIPDGSYKTFSNAECSFSYRNSIFKSSEKGRYMVLRVFFNLSTKPDFKLDYGSLKDEVRKLGKLTPATVRQAVINIRRSKLPDPAEIGNAGSFFKNPIVPEPFARRMKRSFPKMPVFKDNAGTVKLSAGWLIEQCGWKGRREGDAGVYDKQALIIINHGKATGEEILNLSEKIRGSVLEKFGIELEREVEVIGATYISFAG